MPVRLEHNVLIDLIGDHETIMFFRKPCDQQQLILPEDLAAGIGGVANHDDLGPLRKGSLQRRLVDMKVRRHQGHIDRLSA
ncbi:hypothetical protein SDC9_186507 [bioreactor metagenome]|uniref:Uncharacterized protein n=1 Tax=bioreactor metagenome TaxID=1076179 RepID=A0A645HKQ2_9ZZZZ